MASSSSSTAALFSAGPATGAWEPRARATCTCQNSGSDDDADDDDAKEGAHKMEQGPLSTDPPAQPSAKKQERLQLLLHARQLRQQRRRCRREGSTDSYRASDVVSEGLPGPPPPLPPPPPPPPPPHAQRKQQQQHRYWERVAACINELCAPGRIGRPQCRSQTYPSPFVATSSLTSPDRPCRCFTLNKVQVSTHFLSVNSCVQIWVPVL
jgi:hypothetical protein